MAEKEPESTPPAVASHANTSELGAICQIHYRVTRENKRRLEVFKKCAGALKLHGMTQVVDARGPSPGGMHRHQVDAPTCLGPQFFVDTVLQIIFAGSH